MEFNLEHALGLLERTPKVLRELLQGLPAEWIANNEGENTWSPFDVVGHLIHGERVNWLPRARVILEFGETGEFRPFDRQAQFVSSQGKSLNDLLQEFETLRQQNIQALQALDLRPAQLETVGRHPEFGPVRLRELLATWVAHDLDHIVQISRTLAKNYREAVGPWRAYLSVMK